MDNKELLDAIRGIVKEEIDPVRKDVQELNVKVDRIEKKLNETHDEVARTREDITEIKTR